MTVTADSGSASQPEMKNKMLKVIICELYYLLFLVICDVDVRRKIVKWSVLGCEVGSNQRMGLVEMLT